VVLRVGVVGHRSSRLSGGIVPVLEESVSSIFDRILAVAESALTTRPADEVPRIGVVSALAEGADRIVAREALRRGLPLTCPLPFAPNEYEQDFASEASRVEFRRVIARAADVRPLPGRRDEAEAAYHAVGRALVEASDIMIAIWDGEPSRGPGGTADVVLDASARMPVIWVKVPPAAEFAILAPAPTGEVADWPESELEALVAALLR
jgi:hypothetical protein